MGASVKLDLNSEICSALVKIAENVCVLALP